MDFNFMSYVTEEILIVIPVLWIIGAILKTTPKIFDWVIPYVVLVVGILLSCMLIGFDVNGIIQGVLAAGTAVLGDQLVKQAKKR